MDGFRSAAARFTQVCKRFCRAEQGTVAVIAAVGLPVLLVGGAMAVDLTSLYSDKNATQDVADAAALQGANQLSVEPSGATARAKSFAVQQLGSVSSHSTVSVTATQTAANEMTVAIDTHRLSFFANLLPPGGFHTHVKAVARTEASSPLCVLTTDTASSVDDLSVTQHGRLDAPGCAVQADKDLQVDGGRPWRSERRRLQESPPARFRRRLRRGLRSCPTRSRAPTSVRRPRAMSKTHG